MSGVNTAPLSTPVHCLVQRHDRRGGDVSHDILSERRGRIAKSASNPRPLVSPCSTRALTITVRIAAFPASIVISFLLLRCVAYS
jgi:hypothetical protein